MTITFQRIIKVLGCIAAIILAAVVLAQSGNPNHVILLAWGLIAVAAGVLIEAVVP